MSNDYRQTLLKGGTSLDAHRKSLAFHTQTKQGRTIKIDNQTYDIDKLILASLGGKNHRAAQFAKPVLFSSKYLEFLQHCTDYMRLYVREKLAVAFERSTKQGTDVPSVLAHLMSELCKSPSQAPDTISLAEINKQVSHSFHIFSETYCLFVLSFKKRHSQSRDRFMFEV
jgi:hypothetical protein